MLSQTLSVVLPNSCHFHWYFCELTVQVTSEVGSAGLYLEDYFEEQLKQVYPDRIFPGGREEQMIPPLEDEIDEEEEVMGEGMAPLEEEKPPSPEGKGIPPVEEDFPLEESTVSMEEEEAETEKGFDESDKETDKKVVDGCTPLPEEVEHYKETPEQELKSSAVADSKTKDGEAPSIPKEENPLLPTDKSADPHEAQEKESAPAGTAKEEG